MEVPVIIGLTEKMRFCFYVSIFVGLAQAAPPPGGPVGTRRTVMVAAQVSPVMKTDPRSGQLVRTVTIVPRTVESRVVAPLPTSSDVPAPAKMSGTEVSSLVEEMALKHELSPELVRSVIEVESNFNARAVSPKGA